MTERTPNPVTVTVVEKHDELRTYLRGQCFRRNVPADRVEDVIQAVFVRLLEKEAANAFDSARKLFGKASQLTLEEAARFFASNLSVSGMGPSAHGAARKYLLANDGDVEQAYRNQTMTAKVGRDALRAVRGGGGQVDPTAMASWEVPGMGVEPDEDLLLALAFDMLTPLQARVAVLHAGMFGGPPMSFVEMADENIDDIEHTIDELRGIWLSARRKLLSVL